MKALNSYEWGTLLNYNNKLLSLEYQPFLRSASDLELKKGHCVLPDLYEVTSFLQESFTAKNKEFRVAVESY